MGFVGRKFWNIFPLFEKKPPKARNLSCPVCGSKMYFKHAHTFKRSDGEYRMDIAVECPNCALVLVFEVHITESEYKKFVEATGGTVTYANTGNETV